MHLLSIASVEVPQKGANDPYDVHVEDQEDDFKRRFRLKLLDEFSDIYNPLLSISTENKLYRRDLRAVYLYFEINRQVKRYV